MTNGTNDELTFAAPLLLATLFLFGWRKLRDYSGTIDQMVQFGVPVPAVAVATFMELPVAFAVAVGVHAAFGFTHVFLHAGTVLIRTSLLDNDGACRLSRQHGWLLQKFFHHGKASCCCTFMVRENIPSMHCAISPHHNISARRIRANGEGHVRIGGVLEPDTSRAEKLSDAAARRVYRRGIFSPSPTSNDRRDFTKGSSEVAF
jgi:hypothetical protein